MILLVGEDSDSILYFRTRIEGATALHLPSGIEAYQGRLGGEEAIVATIGVGMALTCLRTSHLITRFRPYLVFHFGSAVALREDVHRGDIIIADRYYLQGVDFSSDGKSAYGQFPGFPEFLTSDTAINNQAEAAAYALGGAYVERGFLVSGDKDYVDAKDVAGIVSRHYQGSDRIAAYDTSSAGVALACHLGETALLTAKAISYEPSKPEQYLERRRKGLESSSTLGEIVIAMLVRNRNLI